MDHPRAATRPAPTMDSAEALMEQTDCSLLDRVVRRPVAVAMLFTALVALGLWAVVRIPVEFLPNVESPRVTIATGWTDASPEAVEAQVTSPLEAAVTTVPGVRKVESESRAGRSRIELEFVRGTDMDFAELELRERLAAAWEELPDRVGLPRVSGYVPREFRRGQFLSYRLAGPQGLHRLRGFAVQEFRPSLLALEGVAEVEVVGGGDREVRLVFDPDALASLNLSPLELLRRVTAEPVVAGAVRLERGDQGEVLVLERVVEGADALADLSVETSRGTRVALDELVRVEEGYGPPLRLSRIDGQEYVTLRIDREPGSHTLGVARQVKARLAELSPHLAPGASLVLVQDESEAIRRELTRLRTRGLLVLLVVFLVLLAFLRDLRAALLVLSSILFSLLIAINLFHAAGITLNLFTLAGLALGLGMIVDNAIVVSEAIDRHRARGEPPMRAAVAGTREVVRPVMAATLTSAVVFVPFLFLAGELRLYYLPLAAAVALAVLASLVTAFVFIPTAVPRWTGRRVAPRGSGLLWTGRITGWSVRHAPLVIGICLGGLVLSYKWFDTRVERGRIFAFGEETHLWINFDLPRGAELDQMDRLVQEFEDLVIGLPGVDRVFAWVAAEAAGIRISFTQDAVRGPFPVYLKERLQAYATRFAGAEVRVFGFGPSFYGGGAPPTYSIQVRGYNYLQVKVLAEAIGRRLERLSRVREVNTNASGLWAGREAEPELRLVLGREALARLDVSPREVLETLRYQLPGRLGRTRMVLGGEEREVYLLAGGVDSLDIDGLRAMLVSLPEDRRVRLGEIARIEEHEVLSRILREDQQYQRLITYEFRGPPRLGNAVYDALFAATELPPGYSMERREFRFLGEGERSQLLLAVGFVLLLVFMVTAGLFESLLLPFLVFFAVPLSLIGVFLIFVLTGTPFTREAYVGLILLGGIVVNNAILLVDRVNTLEREGLALAEAIHRGTAERVRPILMTTATTVLGLLPLVLFASPEETVWHTIALTTVGGLLTSAPLTLIAVPALTSLLFRLHPPVGA